MAISDNLGIFFNKEEFATEAWIRGCLVAGLVNQGSLISNAVETQKTTFICSSKAVLSITHGERLLLQEQKYTVVGIQPDGTGLTTLVLERL